MKSIVHDPKKSIAVMVVITLIVISIFAVIVVTGPNNPDLILYPTDLTINANITGGTFPDSIESEDDLTLNISESCWRYEASNNTTYCDTGKWTLQANFEFNSLIPRFKNAKLYFTAWKSGDNEQIRFRYMNWVTGEWIYTGIQLTSTPKQYTLGMTNIMHSLLFGSAWMGFYDWQDDSTRTTIHIDSFYMEVFLK